MPGPDLRLFRGSALSLASQAVGLAQLLVLLWRTGANDATDAYFYLFSLGLLPTQILTVGVMYPMMLTEDRIGRATVRRLMRIVPVMSVGSALAGAAWLSAADRLDTSLTGLVALSCLNAAVQAMLWQRSVAAAAAGSPGWEAAVALPANVLATIVVAGSWLSPTGTVTAMMVALVVGNASLLAYIRRRGVGDVAIARLPVPGGAGARTMGWFLAKSSTGYGGLVVLQSLAVLLPPSAVTLLSVATKVVGSVSATFINAVMPRLVHQETSSSSSARRFLRAAAAVVLATGLVGVAAVTALFPAHAPAAAVIALWLLVSTSAASAQRIAFRFLPPSASRATLIGVPTVVILALASATLEGFRLVTLLCAYAGADALVATLLSRSLRDRVMTAAGGMATALLAVIWFASLTP